MGMSQYVALLYSQIKASDWIGYQWSVQRPYWTAKRHIEPGNRMPTSINKQKRRQKFLSRF